MNQKLRDSECYKVQQVCQITFIKAFLLGEAHYVFIN